MQAGPTGSVRPSPAASPAGCEGPAPQPILVHPAERRSPRIYDKRHLFTLAGEHDHFKAGTTGSNWNSAGSASSCRSAMTALPRLRAQRPPHPYDLASTWPIGPKPDRRLAHPASSPGHREPMLRGRHQPFGNRWKRTSVRRRQPHRRLSQGPARRRGQQRPTGHPPSHLNRDEMMAFRRKLPFLEDADARQT